MKNILRLMQQLYETAHEVDRSLWVGGCLSAMDRAFIEGNNIRRIVRLVPLGELREEGIEYRQWPDVQYCIEELPDSGAIDYLALSSRMKRALIFIMEGLASGDNVLVHCRAGISRAAMVAAIVIMTRRGAALEDVFRDYLIKRTAVNINANYQHYLGFVSEQLRKRLSQH